MHKNHSKTSIQKKIKKYLNKPVSISSISLAYFMIPTRSQSLRATCSWGPSPKSETGGLLVAALSLRDMFEPPFLEYARPCHMFWTNLRKTQQNCKYTTTSKNRVIYMYAFPIIYVLPVTNRGKHIHIYIYIYIYIHIHIHLICNAQTPSAQRQVAKRNSNPKQVLPISRKVVANAFAFQQVAQRIW